jgi:hypothetical protein
MDPCLEGRAYPWGGKAGSSKDSGKGPEKHAKIQPKRLSFEILKVGEDSPAQALSRIYASDETANLRQAGNSWLDEEAVFIKRKLLSESQVQAQGMGARSNDCHVSQQNIEELRKFVQPHSANETTNTGYARVVSGAGDGAKAALQHRHRPEFDYDELAPAQTSALLAEKYRP